ncbi:UbiA prenyltransferase family protein [Candidatus Bathyarchaeota archaeon]|nr:UbiA prenyltransferase family protein [Candidatus Bathyarchaeota archaeon]
MRSLSILEITRPQLNFMGATMAGSGAALALMRTSSHEPPWLQVVLGVIAVFASVGAMHTFNDYVDRIRDKTIWPSRPLPSGRVRPREALVLATLSLGLGLAIALMVFNQTCFTVMVVTAALGLAYARYLRDRVGYLSLPPIVGLIPVGGYAAFAPRTVLSDPLIWLIYLMTVFWQSGHILVYSPAHGMIVDGGAARTAVPAFKKRLTAVGTAELALAFFVALLGVNICFSIVTPMSPIYLIITAAFGLFTAASSLRLVRETTETNSVKAFKVASTYAIIMFSAITFELLVRLYAL